MLEHELIDFVFLFAIVSMWAILFYHSFLLIAAYDFFLKGKAALAENLSELRDFPFVSILIPAHNEELVIERTLNAMLELDYPKDKIQIVPINDNSTDGTREILERFAADFPRVQPLHVPPGEGGKGKAHALNLGIRHAKGEVLCVYDADNSPEPSALKYLVAELKSDPKLAVVCGKVRTQNRKRNLLTRFINLEFISHQWMVQGGRWHLHRFAMIPGTNFVMWRRVLDALGGWDPHALAEDAELTMQIRALGYEISFNPFAITWEQEPETWSVWFRQRLRWIKGNRYIVKKYLSWSRIKLRTARFILYMVSIYTILMWTLILSDLIFLLGILGFSRVTISGPLYLTWFMGFCLFITSIMVTLTFEETSECTLKNFGIALLMYFTYSQMWILLSLRSILTPFERDKGGNIWDKTRRFKVGTAK